MRQLVHKVYYARYQDLFHCFTWSESNFHRNTVTCESSVPRIVGTLVQYVPSCLVYAIKFTKDFIQRKSVLLVIWFDITYTEPTSPTAHTGIKIPQIYQYILTPSQNCFVIIVAISITLKWIISFLEWIISCLDYTRFTSAWETQKMLIEMM